MKKIVLMFLVVFFGISFLNLNINSVSAKLMKNKEEVVKDVPEQEFLMPLSDQEKKAFETGKEIPFGSALTKREKVTLEKKTVQRGETIEDYIWLYILLAFVEIFLLGILILIGWFFWWFFNC